jgi:hypothetical protein
MVGATFTVAAVVTILRSKKGISAVGNAQVDTAQSYFGGASALFDGTGDGLVTPSNSDFAFGTGNFTIEYWMRPTTLVSFDTSFDARSGAEAAPVIYTESTTLKYGVGNTEQIAGGTLSTNVWHHIAVCRSGTSTKLFLNGTQVGSTYTDTNTYVNIAPVYIGSIREAGGSFDGHLDEIRISNSARYTTTFTPSTTPFVNDANTLLLIHANGTDASTFFEDDNGVRASRSLIAIGGAQISTTQSKFGGASALFDGTNDYVNITYSDDIVRWNDANYTVEYWIRIDVLASTQSGIEPQSTIIGNKNPTDGTNYWSFGPVSNGTVRFKWWSGAENILATTGVTLTTSVWYHLAAVRNGTNLKIYVDGTERASTTVSTTPQYSTGVPLNIGAFNSVYFDGNLDEIRISNTARYTTTFTPSTTPFTNDANTLLLVHADGTDASTVFRDDNGAREQKGISANGNAQVDTAQSYFGGASLLMDGTGDYLSIADTTGFGFTGDFTIEFWARATSLPEYSVLYSNFVTGFDGIYFGYWHNANKFSIYINGSERLSASDGLSTNTWYHIALVRSGSTLTLYRDGTSRGTGTYSGTVLTPTFTAIGVNTEYLPHTWAGYMDEVRVSNSARYTANFTPSTTPFQNDANTVLLLHCDGTDASTVFFDDNGIAPYTP